MGYKEKAPGYYLEKLYDKERNKYYTIETLKPEEVSKLIREGYKGQGIKTAVLDTGVMTHHPTIKKALKKSVNFTEEKSAEDLNGHGTMAALILLSTAPDTELYNVKVMNASIRGKKENLVKGIEWCIENDVRIINTSLAVYSLTCEGDCIVCNAAKKALDKGIMIVAAAGNIPGITACPAKLANYGYPIIAVGVDADYSGTSPFTLPETRLRYVEITPGSSSTPA